VRVSFHAILLFSLLGGFRVLALGQNVPAQDSNTTQGQSQGTGDATTGTVRNVPATALSAPVGIEGDATSTGDPSRDLPQIPSLLGGAGISMAFLTEMERSNYLRAGINVGATYDDNPYLLSNGTQSNTSESVFPNISIEQTTSRTFWSLGYAGGLTVNQNFSSQNQGSHSVNFDSRYRLSPHINLRVAERFSLTTGFFDSGSNAVATTGSGGPNANLITPLSTQMSTVTTAEMNYHFAINDLIGASGSFYDLHYTNVSPGAVLADSQTETGAAFWLHRLFRDDWGGLAYKFDRITFNPDGQTLAHSFLVVNTLHLANGLRWSIFAGPQYSNNQGLIVGSSQVSQSNHWETSAGCEIGWQMRRTSLSVGYSRVISDGAGVLGAVRLENEYGSFRREIAPGWAVTMTATHGTNRSLTVPFAGAATSINLTSVSAGLERNVGKKLGLRLSYTHDFQQQFGIAGSTQNLDAQRNLFAATLSYQWARPLGR
jgi:hypothetical protein